MLTGAGDCGEQEKGNQCEGKDRIGQPELLSAIHQQSPDAY